MFTQKFSDYVYDKDSVKCEVDGFTCYATLYLDDSDMRPDERDEGFWPSQKPNDTGYCPYNFDEAMARAKMVMAAWENDEWHYYGVAVTVFKNGVQLTPTYAHSVWGIEGNYPDSNNDYFTEVANDILPEAIDDAKAVIKKLCE